MKQLISVALLVVLATPVFSQEPSPAGHDHQDRDQRKVSHMDQMKQMMAPMMSAMAFAPEHLLSRRDSLGLTAPQVSRLTSLQDAAKTAHDAAEAGAKAHMTGLSNVMRASAPDTGGLRQHFEAAHDAMGKAHWAMLSAAAQARAVLTDEQRAGVERRARMMKEHESAHHGP